MTDKITLQEWLDRESQWTIDGHFIWRLSDQAERARALHEALRVLPETALLLLGITAHESRTAASDGPSCEANENFDNYFGACPHCHRHDGFINIGRGHWFYCKEHKTKWWAGSNLFSCWREQSEDQQRRIYDELGFGEFKNIDGDIRPPPGSPVPVIDDDLPF